jgi:hypothetical protein
MAFPFALLATALGTAAQQVGVNQSESARMRELDANLRRQQAFNNRAGERVSREIQNVAAANPEEERLAAQNDFMAALRKAKVADGGDDFAAPAGASDRFTADVGQARAAAGAEGRALSGNLAAIDAPQYSRIKEGRGLTDTAIDLSLLGGESQGQDFLSQLRLASAAGKGSGLQALGGGIAAFGNSYAQRAKPVKLSPASGFTGPR